jgi:hypothetical protein
MGPAYLIFRVSMSYDLPIASRGRGKWRALQSFAKKGRSSQMFEYKHYVPILKSKRAEFASLGAVKKTDAITPLLEAVPSQMPDAIPKLMAKCGWPAGKPYFVDMLFFDTDEDGAPGDPPLAQVADCINSARSAGQIPIPVTGTGRSQEYQAAVRECLNEAGVAVRLIPEDFGDKDELSDALNGLLAYLGTTPASVDVVVDLGSVSGQAPALVTQTHLRQFATEGPCNSLILLAGVVSDAKM